MELEFFGAAGEVTGSCHVLHVNGRLVLLDCGMIQGSAADSARNREPFPFDPTAVDAVVLSHAHIDHSGRLPRLVREGYRGPIHTQNATRDLCRIMLRDAAYISEKDAEWENRKRERKGLDLVEPLYSVADAEACLELFEGMPYEERREILPGVSVRFVDAGHILGSAIVELWLSENGVERKLVFTGDLGHSGKPILRDPVVVESADLVLMESTYGDRNHRDMAATLEEMHEVVGEAGRARGNILIPAFAVGRSQELLFFFAKYYDDWNLKHWKIFLDSPMAIEATEVYARYSNLYDKEAAELWQENKQTPLLPNLFFSRSPEESMVLNTVRNGAIIVAASGMCEGGRIRHHLKHNLWRKECHIVIVGYQAVGTIGRALVDGARYIRLWGETVKVAATIHTVGGLSAHADRRGLSSWYGHFRNRPPVWLVHGEPAAQQGLVEQVEADRGVTPTIAAPGDRLDLVRLQPLPAHAGAKKRATRGGPN